MMVNSLWPEFGVLFTLALAGGAAVLPFALRLFTSSRGEARLDLSVPKLLALSFIQTAVLSGVTVGVGLCAAHALGLGAPYIEAVVGGATLPAVKPTIVVALGLGVANGAFLLLLELSWLPHVPRGLLDSTRATSLWQNFAACFYGGINEELLFRLFGLSSFAWVLSRAWQTNAGMPTIVVFWVANVTLAVAFGLGHLPAVKRLVERVGPFLWIRTVLLNGVVGITCGWLFFRRGLEAAMVSHFTADLLYHVGGTLVLRLNDKYLFRRMG